MPKNSQILKIEPPEALTFTGPFTEVVKSTLTLTNPSDTKVAFKIKTTAPKRYCVRPNSGSLSKDESMQILVMLQPFEFDPHEKAKHKFMIQSLVVNSDMDEKDLWVDADKDKLMDTKLRVVFDNPTTPETVKEAAKEDESEINNLDISSEPVKMTPHKVNLIAPPNVSASGDDERSGVTDDNKRLTNEVNTLREEIQRLKRVGMADTKSAGLAMTSSQSSATPTANVSLFQDTKTMALLLVLLVAAFVAGIAYQRLTTV